MKARVNINNVALIQASIINKGELNINKIEFEFSSEYSSDFVKKAVFIGSQNGIYEVAIIDNKCNIPSEVLRYTQNVVLGVYAYKVEDEEIKRYSPAPTSFLVSNGSYSEETIPSEEITPSQFEQYNQALQADI